VAVLGALVSRGLLEVIELHGVSSGAITGACYLAVEAGAVTLESVYRSYQYFMTGTYLCDSLYAWMDEAFPLDIHERASGRLFVTLHEFDFEIASCCIPYKRVVSDFPTRAFFLDAIIGSTTIPGITRREWVTPTGHAKLRWMDGVNVCDPLPTAIPQLRIDLGKAAMRLCYPLHLFLYPVDANFDVRLCMRGLRDIVRLIAHGDVISPVGTLVIRYGGERKENTRTTSSKAPRLFRSTELV
jgi:hypothetical protein